MLYTRGLRISLAGAVIFLAGISSLVVLPDLVAVIGMTLGGTLVFAGFVWTIFSYYTQPNA